MARHNIMGSVADKNWFHRLAETSVTWGAPRRAKTGAATVLIVSNLILWAAVMGLGAWLAH